MKVPKPDYARPFSFLSKIYDDVCGVVREHREFRTREPQPPCVAAIVRSWRGHVAQDIHPMPVLPSARLVRGRLGCT